MSKTPPHAKDVAARLLGACLQPTDEGTDAAYDMAEIVPGPEAFFDRTHQKVAEAILSLIEDGQEPDQMLVCKRLQSMGVLDQLGGRTEVTDLAVGAGATGQAGQYALIVREEYIKRRLIEQSRQTARKAYRPESDALELLEETQSSVLKIDTDLGTHEGRIEQAVETQVERHIETTQKRRSGENPIRGIRSGWQSIDELIGGFGGDDYVVVAARPSMGKSAWAVQLCLQTAENGVKSAIFSLEMGRSQLVDRLIQCWGKVPMQKVRKGWASDQELKQMYLAAQDIKEFPIRIVDAAGLTISSFQAKARRLVKSEGVDLLVVDYLQLIEGEDLGKNREQQVARISRQLKLTAKRLGVPVVALAQVNRKPTQRGGGKRPKISDLRESGAIEQDADVISFIHRVERVGLDEHDRLGIDADGVTDFIVAKQRDGPVGTVYLSFAKQFTRFEEMNAGDAPEPPPEDERSGTIPAWAHSAIEGETPDLDEKDVEPAGLQPDDSVPL